MFWNPISYHLFEKNYSYFDRSFLEIEQCAMWPLLIPLHSCVPTQDWIITALNGSLFITMKSDKQVAASGVGIVPRRFVSACHSCGLRACQLVHWLFHTGRLLIRVMQVCDSKILNHLPPPHPSGLTTRSRITSSWPMATSHRNFFCIFLPHFISRFVCHQQLG